MCIWLRKRAVKGVDEGVELSLGCADVGAGAQAFRIGQIADPDALASQLLHHLGWTEMAVFWVQLKADQSGGRSIVQQWFNPRQCLKALPEFRAQHLDLLQACGGISLLIEQL